MIGEEFFAASAYLSKKPELVGGVKGQDMIKAAVIMLIVVSVVLRILYETWGIGFDIIKLLTVQ